MTTRIDEIRARVEAATEGPWVLANSCSWRRILTEEDRPVVVPTVSRSDGHPDLSIPNAADGEFIAHAREDIPFLLARIEELELALVDARLEAEANLERGLPWNP